MLQTNTPKMAKNPGRNLKPIGFRYSCGLQGDNTGLSHYILLDKKK